MRRERVLGEDFDGAVVVAVGEMGMVETAVDDEIEVVAVDDASVATDRRVLVVDLDLRLEPLNDLLELVHTIAFLCIKLRAHLAHLWRLRTFLLFLTGMRGVPGFASRRWGRS